MGENKLIIPGFWREWLERSRERILKEPWDEWLIRNDNLATLYAMLPFVAFILVYLAYVCFIVFWRA